jgi:hypothetical protein
MSPDFDDEEIDSFTMDSAYAGTLDQIEEFERRHLLEQQGRIAAEISLDLQDKKALYQYAQRCREQAMIALMHLATIDPRDEINIHRAQADVAKFREVIAFIHSGLEAGAQAEQTIRAEYGHYAVPDGDLNGQDPEPAWRRRR